MATRYRNPALTTDAVWLRNGRVLLVRRRHPPFQGEWALPGGFVELRETVEETVVRELFEETGLRARPWKLVGVYSGPDRDPRRPTTTVAFVMRGRGGRPTGGDDAEAAAWVPIPSARPLAFDHERILKDAVRLQGRSARPARSGPRSDPRRPAGRAGPGEGPTGRAVRPEGRSTRPKAHGRARPASKRAPPRRPG